MEKTSAEMLERHIRGKLIAENSGPFAHDVLVQIFSRHQVEDSLLVPAVAEPLIVWIVSGSAVVEERELGGEWTANVVRQGDFFLTHAGDPYELRWRADSAMPFDVMHLYLGLPLLERASGELFGRATVPALREISGGRDAAITSMLDILRDELTAPRTVSNVLIESIAQALAVHLVRNYCDTERKSVHRRSALPAYKLKRVLDFMRAEKSEPFNLARLADAAEMSEFHFSRQFKRSTGLSPVQYFIRLRIAEARQLLRETDRSIISIGMDVGYSSPSHFAQVFRKETGVSPSEYRG